ncbi:M20/M25/M40 family metallo-hydrolase [Adhaeribacter terreus]|uniref:M20/M25/M40 family metallo-hydrolase n=1 Tax=Adhaeribacter terreus TaxID=529703 RepID=A0ABW0EFU7_9BACT
MKKLFTVLLVLLLVFIAFLAFRTLTFSSRQHSVSPVPKTAVSDSAKFHLAKAIRIKTISPEDPQDFDSVAFHQFRNFLQKTYPLTQEKLAPKVINEFSLLYKWQGSDTRLKPVILMGHLDVVPVAEETLKEWKATPFGGEIKHGHIWGRGAIDDKMSIIGILEATEMLLKQGFQPKRTIYLAFGHDEEVGGKYGAQAIVKHLQTENIQAEFVVCHHPKTGSRPGNRRSVDRNFGERIYLAGTYGQRGRRPFFHAAKRNGHRCNFPGNIQAPAKTI